MTPGDREALIRDGHIIIHELPDGKVVAVVRMFASTALVLVTENYGTLCAWNGWERRFCYEKLADAISAASCWDGTDDPPGDWIKDKSPGMDRLNPNFGRQEEKIDG